MTKAQEVELIRQIKSDIRGWSFSSVDAVKLRISFAEDAAKDLSTEGKAIVERLLKPLRERLD